MKKRVETLSSGNKWLKYCFEKYMDNYTLKLEAPWEEVKEMLKEINTDLSDEDLEYEPGHEKEMLERLAKKMDKDVPAVKAWIESVSSNKGLAY
jgi:GTP cyclohydrolase I